MGPRECARTLVAFGFLGLQYAEALQLDTDAPSRRMCRLHQMQAAGHPGLVFTPETLIKIHVVCVELYSWSISKNSKAR